MKILAESAKLYGEAFQNGYTCLMGTLIDDEITESDELIIEQYTLQLDNTYASFAYELYTRIKNVEDPYEQNAIFNKLKCELPSVVFENEFVGSELKQNLLEKWANGGAGGYYAIKLMKTFCNSMEWYDTGNPNKLKRFIDTYKATTPEETSKSPISRIASAYLFFWLKQRNIIQQSINDKELAETVSQLTGYDAEKLRQKGKLTEKSKDKLRNEILKLLKDLDEQ